MDSSSKKASSFLCQQCQAKVLVDLESKLNTFPYTLSCPQCDFSNEFTADNRVEIDIQEELLNYEKSIKKLSTMIDQYEEQSIQKNNVIEEYKNQHTKLKEKCIKLCEEKNTLKEEVNELSTAKEAGKTVYTFLKNTQYQNTQLNKEKTSLKNEIKEQQELISKLKDNLEHTSEYKFEKQNKELLDHMKELQKKQKEMDENNFSIIMQREKMEEETSQMKKEKGQYEKKYKELKNEHDKMINDNKAFLDDYTKLKEEHTTMMKEKEENDNEIDELIEENEKYLKKNKKLQREKDDLKDDCKRLTEKTKNLQLQIQKLQKNSSQDIKDNEEISPQSSPSSIKETNNNLLAEIEKLKSENENLKFQKQTPALSTQPSTQKNNDANLLAEIEKLQLKNKRFEKENKELNDLNNNKPQSKEQTKMDKEKDDNKIISLLQENQESLETIQNYKTQNEKLKKEIKVLSETLQILETEMDSEDKEENIPFQSLSTPRGTHELLVSHNIHPVVKQYLDNRKKISLTNEVNRSLRYNNSKLSQENDSLKQEIRKLNQSLRDNLEEIKKYSIVQTPMSRQKSVPFSPAQPTFLRKKTTTPTSSSSTQNIPKLSRATTTPNKIEFLFPTNQIHEAPNDLADIFEESVDEETIKLESKTPDIVNIQAFMKKYLCMKLIKDLKLLKTARSKTPRSKVPRYLSSTVSSSNQEKKETKTKKLTTKTSTEKTIKSNASDTSSIPKKNIIKNSLPARPPSAPSSLRNKPIVIKLPKKLHVYPETKNSRLVTHAKKK